MEKMNQLMENHIFNTGQRRLHQLPGKVTRRAPGVQLPQRDVMERTRISGIGIPKCAIDG